MFELAGKIMVYFRSLLLFPVYKIRFRNRLCIHVLNSLRGKWSLWLDKNSKIQCGKFLMILGPVYFKSVYGGKLIIGNRCFFNRNCSITCVEEIVIGSGCTFANNLVIVDHDHNIYSDREKKPYTTGKIHIGDHVWVGANVTILKGVTIGNNAVIAAGAVVNHDVEADCIYGGVPAKKIKKYKEGVEK
ncbi:MAG TPA: acyltransferase [Lachnospiraceae bacterium]|nr:acyltransferase [Lachnospiraceae bacterium]